MGAQSGTLLWRNQLRNEDTFTVLTNNTCNLACDMCYLGENIKPEILSTSNMFRIVEEINNNPIISTLGIVGKEPYVNKKSTDLTNYTITHLRENGLKSSVITNGSKLNTLIPGLSLPDYMDISLDGGPKTYGIQRKTLSGKQGDYDEVMKGVEKVLDSHFRTEVSFLNTIYSGDTGNFSEYAIADMMIPILKYQSHEKFHTAIFSPMMETKRGPEFSVDEPNLCDFLELLSQNQDFMDSDKTKIQLSSENFENSDERKKVSNKIEELDLLEKLIYISEKELKAGTRINHTGQRFDLIDGVHIENWNIEVK